MILQCELISQHFVGDETAFHSCFEMFIIGILKANKVA